MESGGDVMDKYSINKNLPWFHGSPLELTELAPGSTITQWKELAEAFSHKPSRLEYADVFGAIGHNGILHGYLYRIDEPVNMEEDIHPHPRSSMDEGVEWITNRPLRLKRVS